MSQADKILAYQRDQLADAWADMLSTQEGRYILSDLLDRCGVMGSSFSGDAIRTGYFEGRRSIGIDLMTERLGPQGASVHADMLIEAERRRMEYEAAREIDERNEDV